MRKSIIRCLSLVLAVTLLAGCFSGCGGKATVRVPMSGGTEALVMDTAYDFSPYYIDARSQLNIENDGWRVAKIGSSLKITSGKTAGKFVSVKKELTDKFVLSTTIDLGGVEGSAKAAIVFESGDTTGFSVMVKRDAANKFTFTLSDSQKVLSSGTMEGLADTAFSFIIEKTVEDSNTITVHMTGNQGADFHVQVEVSAKELLKTVSFEAEKKGTVFSDIAVDTIVYLKGDLVKYATKAFDDLLANFWTGDTTDGYFQTVNRDMVWEWGMAMLALETYYNTTGDESIKPYFSAEWKRMQEVLPRDRYMAMGVNPNIAVDDAAWNAMTLVAIYRMTGDELALDYLRELIATSYDYFQDEDTSNGLWYKIDDEGENEDGGKSIYAAGLVLSALEYHEITKGTDKVDPELYADTMKLYEWIEQYLRRDGEKTFNGTVYTDDDKLYYCDFTDKMSINQFGPRGGPNDISWGGSTSALFGNMAMAAINAKLYSMTGEKQYRTKAVETANAFLKSPYNDEGIFVNDRDAWTNASFVGYFVKDVLSLDGIDSMLFSMHKNTALSIVYNCRTEDGFYSADWNGGNKWTSGGSTADQIQTSATSAHMIIAAAYLEAKGYY